MCIIDKDDKSVSIKKFDREIKNLLRRIEVLEDKIKKLEGVQDEEVFVHICRTADMSYP